MLVLSVCCGPLLPPSGQNKQVKTRLFNKYKSVADGLLLTQATCLISSFEGFVILELKRQDDICPCGFISQISLLSPQVF